jgi:hypothetical protein
MSWTPDYQFRASYVLWHLRSFTQMNFREFDAAHESVCVKVCGCRPHEGGAARTVGPASANLQWRKPREVWKGRASDAMGI